eukprot:4088519-Pleurochrysis_carterae.AAC.1
MSPARSRRRRTGACPRRWNESMRMPGLKDVVSRLVQHCCGPHIQQSNGSNGREARRRAARLSA